MASSEKRRLSAKQIVADIRSGMDDAQLRRKYGLSHRSLDVVYEKLATTGALSEAEIRARAATSPSPDEPHPEPTHGFVWYCPACHTGRDSEFEECPSCGVVVAKFLSRQAVKKSATGPISATIGYGPGGGSTGWGPVVWSILVAVVVGGVLLSWSLHRVGKGHHIAEVSTTISPDTVTEDAEPLQSTSVDERPTEAETTSLAETPEEQQIPAGPLEIVVQEPTVPVPAPERPAIRENLQPTAPPSPVHEKRPPQAAPVPGRTYATGTLRLFTSRDFKQEVVEASKVYPVLFQFR